MPRKTVFAATGLAVCLAAAISLTASAASAIAGSINDYEGRAEHDRGTYVGFDLVKQDGKTKVTHLNGVLPYHCQGSSETFGTNSRGSLKVTNKRFEGTLNIPIKARGSAAQSAHYELSGKLLAGGKAKGTIQGVVVFIDTGARRAASSERCYTGGLRYSLKKGADIPIPLSRTGGLR
jgi:hypothetical protein